MVHVHVKYIDIVYIIKFYYQVKKNQRIFLNYHEFYKMLQKHIHVTQTFILDLVLRGSGHHDSLRRHYTRTMH